MRNSIVIIILVFLFQQCSTIASIVTDIYDDEVVNHANYEILEIHDSLDNPPEQTVITFVDGSGAYGVHINDASITNIYGGTFGSLILRDSSTLNLYGGEFGAVQGIQAASTLNVFGKHFNVSNGSPHATLTGYWEDGSDFSFFFYRMPVMPDNIILHEIPEPASALLLLSGVLISTLKKRGL